MPDLTTPALVLSGWLVWLTKELIAALIRRRATREGFQGIVWDRAGVFCDLPVGNGDTSARVNYVPRMGDFPQYASANTFRVEIEFELANDSDTASVLQLDGIDLWGVEGLRLQHRSPRLAIWVPDQQTYRESTSISVKAHDTTRVCVTLPLGYDLADAQASIDETYGETVPLLHLATIGGHRQSLRLKAPSFAGARLVVWPERCRYPIYNTLAYNEHGRKSGHSPQKRLPVPEYPRLPSPGAD